MLKKDSRKNQKNVESNNNSKKEKKVESCNDKKVKNMENGSKKEKNVKIAEKEKKKNASAIDTKKAEKGTDKNAGKATKVISKKESETPSCKNDKKAEKRRKTDKVENCKKVKSNDKEVQKVNSKNATKMTSKKGDEKLKNDMSIKLKNKKENRSKSKLKLQKRNKEPVTAKHSDKQMSKTNEPSKITLEKAARNTRDKRTDRQPKPSHKKEHNKNAGIENPRKNKYTPLEREMITSGTKKDKIDVLTLIIEKNPDNCFEELNQLLEMAQDDRNDTVYYILKNVKDLLCSKLVLTPEFTRLKRKLVNTFEYYLKNQYIKSKVTKLIYTLLSKNILFIDLIYIFINKLGDKKETSSLVVDYIEKLYMLGLNRDIIKFGLEELYQRDIKARKKILEAMGKIANHDNDSGKINLLFYQALRNKEYTDKTKFEKTLENILQTFLKDVGSISKEEFDETLLLQDYKLQSLNYHILLFLYKYKSGHFYKTLLNYVRKDKMVGYKNMVDYMNLIYEYLASDEDEGKKYNLIESLLSGAIFYDDKYIMSLLIIFSKIITEKSDYGSLHILTVYLMHSNPVIRLLVQQIIDKTTLNVFNPFDDEETKRMQILASQ